MNKRIFIIEDDTNVRFALQAKFRLAGFELEADNGLDGDLAILDRVKRFEPNFLVMDLILPDANGFELLRSIRMDDKLSFVPVFVFTDLSAEDIRRRSQVLGADFYFIKSEFDIDEFVEKVKKIIEKKYSD